MSTRAKSSANRAGGAKPPARPRGRPRSVEADNAIFGAVVALLPQTGLKGLSMEAVAKQAGVSKATVYRRWPSKEDLVMDVLAAIPPPQLDVEDTGSLLGDMDALAAQQIERLGDTGIPRLMPRLLSEAADDPEFLALARARLSQPMREVIAVLLQRAIERGELREDFDMDTATSILHANATYVLLMNGGDLRDLPAAGRPIVALLKQGIGASSSSAGRASARPRSSGSSRAKRARS
jgi:AcrR family transcriptional regulator